jgi:nickel/cobalt exporter
MLVICFSIGLAATMVTAGVVASLSVRHIQKRWSGFGAFARKAPYASSVLMLLIAGYMAYTEAGPAWPHTRSEDGDSGWDFLL